MKETFFEQEKESEEGWQKNIARTRDALYVHSYSRVSSNNASNRTLNFRREKLSISISYNRIPEGEEWQQKIRTEVQPHTLYVRYEHLQKKKNKNKN